MVWGSPMPKKIGQNHADTVVDGKNPKQPGMYEKPCKKDVITTKLNWLTGFFP